MIDTDKLRKLAQAATPHVGHACKYQEHHWLREGHVDFENADLFIASERPQEDAAFYAAANPAAVLELLDRIETAEKELAELRSSMKFRTSLIGRTEAKRDALRAEIEELHVLIAAVKKQAAAEFRLRVKKEEEYARLRAKIEALEQQAPAYWGPKHAIEGGSTTVIVSKFPVNPTDAPLYALPGAQTQGEEE